MHKPTHLPQYIPTIGILLFYSIYAYSSTLYPGGSKADMNAKGFDWVGNYTCDLFHTHGINGELNPARSIGMIGIIILCISLSFFFYQFAQKMRLTRFWKKAIPISGTLCMICAVLIFTDLHHYMLIPTSLLGLFALIGVIKGLLTNNLKKYVWVGGFCMVLIALNNYFYFFDILTGVLPLIQKITIVLILFWASSLNWVLVKKG